MGKRLNWDREARLQKAKRQRTKSGYDELPPVGSAADQARHSEKYEFKNPKLQKQAISTEESAQSKKNFVTSTWRAINAVQAEIEVVFDREQSQLKGSESWKKISPEARHRLVRKFNLQKPSPLQFAREVEINSAFRERSLTDRRNILQALPQRFQAALKEASCLLSPQAKRISLPTATIHNHNELDAWFRKVAAAVQEQLKKGPVIL